MLPLRQFLENFAALKPQKPLNRNGFIRVVRNYCTSEKIPFSKDETTLRVHGIVCSFHEETETVQCSFFDFNNRAVLVNISYTSPAQFCSRLAYYKTMFGAAARRLNHAKYAGNSTYTERTRADTLSQLKNMPRLTTADICAAIKTWSVWFIADLF